MVYVVIGPSRAGKTTFIKNTWFVGEIKHKKDVLKYAESDTAYILGDYRGDSTREGLDRVSRAQIKEIFPQVEKLCRGSKDVVLDGERAEQRPLLNKLIDSGIPAKLIYIRCSPETSIARSRAGGIETRDSVLIACCTRCRNLYNEYRTKMGGQILETDNVKDITKISMKDLQTKTDKIGALILSHGRPNNVKTIQALRKTGFSGPIKIVCDDLDETLPEYKELYGDDVIVFDKMKKLAECDTMDNFKKTNIVLPARNECNRIAAKLGWEYFFELDDDYTEFYCRIPVNGHLPIKRFYRLDDVLSWMIDFLEVSGATAVCFSQDGEMIGGADGYATKRITRKAMN